LTTGGGKCYASKRPGGKADAWWILRLDPARAGSAERALGRSIGHYGKTGEMRKNGKVDFIP